MVMIPKNIEQKLKHNIACCVRKDIAKYGVKGTLTYAEFLEKLTNQQNKCYVCKQEFKYDGENWCYFMPSPDRIYNYSPHTKDNIAVSCVFCNIRMFKQISVKKCGLCKDHCYDGDIIIKSALFRQLGNDNKKIYEYANSQA